MAENAQGRARAGAGDVVSVIRRILAENGRDHVGSYVVAILCMVSIAGATAYLAWIIRDVVDKIFYQSRSDLILLLSGSIFAAFVVRGLASYGQAVSLARIGNNIVARYQARIFDHLMALGMDFYAGQRSGHLAARINENVTGVRDLINVTLIAIARDLVTLIGLVAVMFAQDPWLSAGAFIIGPPLGFAINYLMKRLRRVTRQAVNVNARIIGAMQEATQGIAIVKAFTMEEQLGQRLDLLIEDAERKANKIASVAERTVPIFEILAGMVVSAAIAFTGMRTLATGELPGAMVAFVTALMLAYDPARRLARVQVGIEKALVNARMIYELLDTPPQQRDVSGAAAFVPGPGEIRFENVSFGYAQALPVIRDVTLTAEAGRTLAIVGASGAGKSTLIALVQRFHDPDSGRILIDGQDIAGVTKASLRGSIAYVSQHPYLFEGTIRDNIRYGRPDATDAEVEQAARLAHAEEFIRAQPEGYDTEIGENGANLSGGQRQRLSIARALVRNAPVLLLDEATSALDNESEKKVQDALETVMRGRTTIVIAHRLSTVVNADRIAVMDEGRVVELGTHRELIAREAGLYRRFHDMQAARAKDLEIGAA